MTKIMFQLFEQLDVSMYADDESLSASLHVTSHNKEANFYTLENVYLGNRADTERILQRWDFVKVDLHSKGVTVEKVPDVYNVEMIPLEEIQSLYLVVEYKQGLRYEHKVNKL